MIWYLIVKKNNLYILITPKIIIFKISYNFNINIIKIKIAFSFVKFIKCLCLFLGINYESISTKSKNFISLFHFYFHFYDFYFYIFNFFKANSMVKIIRVKSMAKIVLGLWKGFWGYIWTYKNKNFLNSLYLRKKKRQQELKFQFYPLVSTQKIK